MANQSIHLTLFQGFLFYVRYTLDIVYLPTSIPTARPTRSFAPTISVVPSISPSVTPSSLPSTNERIFEDGAIVATDGVSYTFENCDPINHTYYLTVEVYQTDFFDSSEYVSSIRLNGHLVSDYCNPGLDCDPSYYSCFRDLVVTSYIDSGYLTVDVIGTAAVNQCPLGEYALYVRYSLRHVERSFPTSDPTISAPPSSSPSLSYSPTISHMPTVSPGPTILQVSSMESGSDSGLMSQVGALIILGIVCVSSCIIYLSIRLWKHRSLNLCIGYQHILKKLNLSESATKRRKRKGDISGGAKQDRKKDRQSTRKREKSSKKTKARISSPLPRETRSKDNVVELNMDMDMDMEIDLEDGSNACEHTPLKANSCSDGSDSDSDYEGEGTLVRHLSTTVSPIRHAWTVDSLPSEEKRKSPVPYDEKGDSSDEEDSFDYDNVNVQVRLRYGESMPRLDETRMGTTTSSLAHGDTPVFDDIGIEDFDEEPFMGHRL